MVAPVYDLSTLGAEEFCHEFETSWVTWSVPSQPGLQNEPLSQNKKFKKQTKKPSW